MTALCIDCGVEDRHLRWCPSFVPPSPPHLSVVRDYTEPKPRARRTDPPESHAAAASVRNVTEAQTAVLELLDRFGPLTDLELAMRHADEATDPVSPSGLRTRRAELTEAGLVHDTLERRESPSGRLCAVWAKT